MRTKILTGSWDTTQNLTENQHNSTPIQIPLIEIGQNESPVRYDSHTNR